MAVKFRKVFYEVFFLYFFLLIDVFFDLDSKSTICFRRSHVHVVFELWGLKLQEKIFRFVKKKNIRKIKVSCSITNLTKPNQI